MTTGCRNTHIALIQCKFGELGYQLVQSLSIASPELPCLKLKANIIDTYIDMMYCYQTFPSALTYFYSFDTSLLNSTELSGVILAIEALSIYTVEYSQEDSLIYVYSYNAGASHAAVLAAIAGVTGTAMAAANLILTPEVLLNWWNCITYEQFCNIINHAYSMLDSVTTDIVITI